MPKKLRLSHADFALLQKLKPRRIHGTHFSLATYTLPRSIQGPKVAYVVQKKIAPRAVTRNTIERQCRAVTRSHREILEPHQAYVLYAKKDAQRASFKEIQKDIATLFERSVPGSTIHKL